MIGRIYQFAFKALGCPVALLALAGGVAAFSLAAAYTGEYVFGLMPCILCLYQRIPFAIVVALSLTGLALRKNAKVASLVILLCAAAFITNSGIAFYHTGIEQKWWVAGPAGCAFTPGTETQERDLLETILSTPAKDCAEIAWQDPIFGFSMANLNVMLCLGMGLVCLIGFVRLWTKDGFKPSQANPERP